MLAANEIQIEDIVSAIFTLTKDLNADFPAKYARLECGFNLVPMMCFNELDVDGSLEKCLRILLTINTNKTQKEIKHIYLKGAAILRGDLKND
jgi:chorismate mutase